MASLLDGIEFDGDKKKAATRSGTNPRMLKVSAAAAMLLLAGVFFAMQAGMLPWPFAGGQNSTVAQREAPLSEEEVREINERLQQDSEDFIEDGGQIGLS